MKSSINNISLAIYLCKQNFPFLLVNNDSTAERCQVCVLNMTRLSLYLAGKGKSSQESARIVDHQGTEGLFLCKLNQHFDVGGSCKSTAFSDRLLVWNLQHALEGLPDGEL